MEKLDFKKAYRELYLPGTQPSVVEVPQIPYLAVDGRGDPNTSDGEYAHAVAALYALSYTIKMSKMQCPPQGYFEYVVPPLEGLWWFADGTPLFAQGVIRNKTQFCWTAMIRQPDFVTPEVLEWAKQQCARKKPEIDLRDARLMTLCEGLCVQMMHKGPYDAEASSVRRMEAYIAQNGLEDAQGEHRCGHVCRHHEIYLSDPRRTAPQNLKTVLRIPVRRCGDA